MSNFDDEIGGDEPDDGYDESTGRFCDALESLVSYHLEEYDLTGAAVVGALVIEAIRRSMDVIYGPDEPDDEDEDLE